MDDRKPVIFIVNGSFSPTLFYEQTTRLLEEAGYIVKVADYPSIGRRDPEPAATMSDDAQSVHDQLLELIAAGQEPLVVAHSYGGVPGSESLKHLPISCQTAESMTIGVRGILYVAALVPKVGESLGDMMGSQPAPFVSVDGDYMSLEPVGNAKVDFSDMPFEEALPWAKRMPEHSTISFGGKLTYAGYQNVPVSYLFTTKDQVVAPELQRTCIKNIEQSGNSVQVIELDSGHVPFISRPEETAKIIRRVAGEVL